MKKNNLRKGNSKMKKYLILLLALVLVVSMSACGKKEEEKPVDPPIEGTESDQKVTVVKGDWISATKGNMKFEVRDNWVNEKREVADIDYYYFDESKLNYLLVSHQENGMGLTNSKTDIIAFLGSEFKDEDGLEFKENEAVTVGNDIGGFKLVYNDFRESREHRIAYTEFYTIYQDSIYWFCISVKEDYVDDYMEDVEHILNSLQTTSGEGNPVAE